MNDKINEVRINHMNDYVYENDIENVKRLYSERGYFTVSALKIALDNGYHEIAEFIVDRLDQNAKLFLAEDVARFNDQ